MVYWGCGGAAGQMYRWQLLLTIFFVVVVVIVVVFVVDKWPVYSFLFLLLLTSGLFFLFSTWNCREQPW